MRDVAMVVGALALINVLAHFTIDNAAYLVVPLGSIIVIMCMRWRGFSWRQMGLAPDQFKRGAKYALPILLAVTVIAIGGAIIPFTRTLFLSDRYDTVGFAVYSALLVIPLQTVIPEELLFRGALDASLRPAVSSRAVYVVGASLFGLWHVGSSTGLTAGNDGLTDLLGSGVVAQVTGIAGAVVVTTCAGLLFIWLRHRSDSLLVPVALHWAVNGIGALGAALAWQLSG